MVPISVFYSFIFFFFGGGGGGVGGVADTQTKTKSQNIDIKANYIVTIHKYKNRIASRFEIADIPDVGEF